MSSPVEAEKEWVRSTLLPKILTELRQVPDAVTPGDGAHEQNKSIEHSASSIDDFQIEDIDINFIGADEAFMLTSCYRTVITYKTTGAVRTIKLVVKKTPPVPMEMYNSINFDTLFNNEIQMYTVVVPILENFIKSPLNLVRHYYSERQQCFAVIVLQDFSTRNWRMTENKFNLSLDHVMLAVKYIGRFHGIGFALKQKEPKVYNRCAALFKESRFAAPTPHPVWHLKLKQARHRLLKATQAYEPQVGEEFLDKLCALVADPYVYGKQRVQPQEPLVTLCHGDFLRNNMAYRYDVNTHKPNDVMMFDLQTMRASSPMIDLTIFLSLSTFAGVRYQHFDEIFDAYCQQLTDAFTEYSGQQVPEYLSRLSLLKEYVRYMPYSVSTAAYFLGALVEPVIMNSESFLRQQASPEEVIADTMTRGGEVCDRELAHQVREMYELSAKYSVDICEGVQVCDIDELTVP